MRFTRFMRFTRAVMGAPLRATPYLLLNPAC
jgi:hypothetical protein